MFEKLLIANRGEIACRIIQTCRRLGIATVAVYSQADAGARHVRMADEAHCIGPAASSESYLRADRILEVARRSGAQAVHPGYGFLSENAEFAQACADAGIVFVGPPVEAIRAMGSKSAAKALMEAAGVPLVRGYHGDAQEPALLREQADRIGYPVLIKAAAGGGGKGMRVVERAGDFADALASCRREAVASFGDARVLIEQYLQRPRHIEIQVFGDAFGNLIHLHERDCSAQRRHQKVVEEAPAPGMDAARRAAMGQAACDAARAVGYVGAGTVEFIVDAGGAFHFMEMNTRLQVEHPVTEMITGLDLVEWQLRVAAGEALPLRQDQIPLRGHAIEVRVYAEEPEKGFLPSIGTLVHCAPPAASRHVRVDSGVEQGDAISPHYDPMIAKLIVWDETRDRAIARLLRALGAFRIVGVGNNLGFLERLIGHAAFRAGEIDTGLIARESDALLTPAAVTPDRAFAVAALWTLADETRALREASAGSADRDSPWAAADGWRVNGAQTRVLHLRAGDDARALSLTYAGGAGSVALDGAPAAWIAHDEHRITCTIAGHTADALVVPHAGQLHVFVAGGRHVLARVDPLAGLGESGQAHGGLVAPMPGRIVALLVEPGSEVEADAPVLVMEAMKMEYTLSAPAKGRVERYLYAVGDQVADGAALADFVRAEA